MSLERVFIQTEDNIELAGLLAKPEQSTEEVIISIHGMQSNCLKQREAIIENEVIKSNIAYFSFNNRGQDLMCYTKKTDGSKILNGGSIYEDVLDSYYDIKASVEKMIQMGYTKIYLQGHSLGCTKIVYTYNKLKKENYKNLNLVKGIILLSLVDLIDLQKYDLGIEKYNEILNLAIQKEANGEERDLMPEGSFDHPISVKSYLRYYRDNKDIDFARFSDENYSFNEINNIEIPLFLRWGEKDLVIQDLNELVLKLSSKIKNTRLDIAYIEDTDHGYSNKEEILAKNIISFIKNIKDIKGD